MCETLPPEIWIKIGMTDEHTFNSLVRAVSSLGRWTMGARDGVYDSSLIINRRLDLMLLFGYSVEFTSGTFGHPESRYTCSYISWTKNGKRHRNDRPAITSAMGDIYRDDVGHPFDRGWFYHDELHRVGGPASEGIDLYFAWYRHGTLYKCDGPSKIYDNIYVRWTWGDYPYRHGGPTDIVANGDVYWFLGSTLRVLSTWCTQGSIVNVDGAEGRTLWTGGQSWEQN